MGLWHQWYFEIFSLQLIRSFSMAKASLSSIRLRDVSKIVHNDVFHSTPNINISLFPFNPLCCYCCALADLMCLVIMRLGTEQGPGSAGLDGCEGPPNTALQHRNRIRYGWETPAFHSSTALHRGKILDYKQRQTKNYYLRTIHYVPNPPAPSAAQASKQVLLY